MHLNVFASQSCFVHCKGCYSYSREEKKGVQVPTDELLKFLEFIYNKGTRKVTFCGGDPLARKDIIGLLEKTKSIGFSISIDTMGTPIIRDALNDRGELIKKIDVEKISKYVDMIGIPIDGSTNEIFRRFRQTRVDIINEQLSVCEELNKVGANICINTVAHKGNLDDARELAKLIKKLDYINKWQIFQYEPLGKFGLLNRKKFEITDQQFLEFKSAVIEVFNDDYSKLQFKSYKDRKNAYMLVNNSGIAWIPSGEIMSLPNFPYLLGKNIVIGDIGNSKEWSRISSYLDKDFSQINKEPDTIREILELKKEKRVSFINKISNNGEYRNVELLKEDVPKHQIDEIEKLREEGER